MENILVATDLSSNSASAIRFAGKLAQLKEVKLIITYVYYIRKPHTWRTHRFETYLQIRELYFTKKLNNFLKKIFNESDESQVDFEIELIMNLGIITTLLNTALAHKATYICISTQGNGKSDYKIGSITSKLIVKSPIPVISIPSNYKIKPLKEICYVSNLSNYQKEIKKVIDFASPLHLAIRMLHIVSSQETLPKINTIETKLVKRTGTEIKVKFVKRNPINTLCEDINNAVIKMKCEMLVFFIHRSKPYLISMFHPTKNKALSFYAKLPILSFKK
jgi:nucleotide-binding universal stress UspA family protein